MAGKELSYRIDVNASNAVASLRSFESAVRKTMREVEGELDATASAGDKVAASLDKLAASMREDFAKATTAAEKMQQALKDAGSGLDVSDVLPTLQRMGLSFEEITQDADKLAVSLKQLDDVRMAGVVDLDSKAPGLASKLDDVSKSADSSKSALANMIGNSAQDLGELSGVAGSAGVAVGQMAEYFADAAFEGESLGSVLGSFAKVAVPIGALALGTKLLTDAMGKGAKAAEAHAEGVERIAEAAKDGTGTLGAFRKQIEDTGKLSFTLGGGFDFAGIKIDDLRKNLANAGLTLEDFADVVAMNDAAEREWSRTQREAGASEEDLIKIHLAAVEARNQLAEAELENTLNTRIGAEETENATKVTKSQTDGMLQFARVLYDAAADQNELTNAQKEAETQARRLTRQMEILQGQLDFEQAALNFGEAFAAANTKAQEGTALTAQEVLDLKRDYITVADYLGHNPAQIQSNLDRIEAGDVAGVLWDTQAQINNRPEPHIGTKVDNPDNTQQVLDATQAYLNGRPVRIPARVVGQMAAVDKGGYVGPGGAVAAEIRPEFIRLPGRPEVLLTQPAVVPPGTQVTSGAETARILGRGAAGHTTINVHLPRGSRPDDTVAAIRKYARRNGGRRAR